MRRLLVWLAVLAVLAGGGVMADNFARDYAEQRVSAEVTTQLDATGVEVSLGGVPFSLALLTSRVPNAVITAASASLPVAEQEIELTDLSLTTGEVQLQAGELLASDVSGAAALSYAELEKLAKVPVGYAPDGRLALRYQVTVFAQEVELAVTALPVLDPGTASIKLTEPQGAINGNTFDLPVDQALIDLVVRPIDVGLDYGLAITDLTPAEAGLSVAFGGTKVVLPIS